MVLEVYGDPMSGVCRAVFAFVMMNKIEHELKFISLYDNEHKTPEFLAINPGGYVPVIVDDGFAICETASILGYLADTRGLQDPWYPTDLKKRAVVDRFFSWYHAHLRLNGAALPFMTVFAKQVGKEFDPEAIEEAKGNLPKTLRAMDTWIKDQGYIAGEQMTIADLLAACDTAHFVEFLNYDISNFSNLYKWYKKMMAIPEVHEVHEAVYALAKKLTNSVVLYGHPASPPCRAVETVMKMAGIQYEYKIVDLFKGEQFAEEFKAMNEMTQVPVLKHGETVVQESCAIMTYLMRQFGGDDSLFPAGDAKTRARINRILQWSNASIHEPSIWTFENKILAKVVPDFPYAEWKAERAAFTFNNDSKRKGTFGLLDQWLGERPFLCSDQATLADFQVYWEMKDLEFLGHTYEEYPTLLAWIEKMSQIPQVQEVQEGWNPYITAIQEMVANAEAAATTEETKDS